MNDFKFFKGVTITEPTSDPFRIDPFQTVPENYRIESVDPIYNNPRTLIPTRRVYCRHIVTEELCSFLVTETHWLWDYNDGLNPHNAA